MSGVLLGAMNCFPLRTEWEFCRPPGPVVQLPAPEVTSRDPWPADVRMPVGPKRVGVLAERCGWTVRATYARGPWQPKNRPWRIIQSIALRIGGRAGRAAVAVWHCPIAPAAPKWTFDSALIVSPEAPVGMFAGCSITDLGGWLEAGGEVPEGWYQAVADRVSAQAARAKEKASSAPRRIREDLS